MMWNEKKILNLFELPFFELIQKAYHQHTKFFDPADVEFCTLSSIKTGACPEDCAYCSQSAHYKTGLRREKLLEINTVIQQAKMAKKNGATRFCMGAAWRDPPKKDFPRVLDMIQAVKKLGLEACVTLGMLNARQAKQLKEAGLDFYNHNLDTSPEYYESIVTTRSYQERLDTIEQVINADIKVCCGCIVGMGETRSDRINFLLALYQLPVAPKSIPINKLIPVPGTPLENSLPLDHFEFIKTIAVTRLMFPKSRVRLSAGRENMSDEVQAWCFMAGANSIFIGDLLLTARNATQHHDSQLLKKLGINVPEVEGVQNDR